MSSSADFDLPADVKYDIACMEAFDFEPDQNYNDNIPQIPPSNNERIISQLRSEVDSWRIKWHNDQNTIFALKQQLNHQQSTFDAKFNEFLVCANNYDKAKSEEIESLKQRNAILSKKYEEIKSKLLSLSGSETSSSTPLSSECVLTETQSNNTNISSVGEMDGDHSKFTVEQLKQIRIRQKNIVYVVGLPVSLCNAKLLKSSRWFGKYGNISRICFNTSPKCVKANSIPTFVTYNNEQEALNAIQRMNLYCLSDGTRLKTNYGRTKYCPTFCQGQQCLNTKCKFLHHWAAKEDIITQEEINDFNAIRAGPPSRFNKK